MQQIIDPGGPAINVHYVVQQGPDGITAVDDFKIVIPGPRPE